MKYVHAKEIQLYLPLLRFDCVLILFEKATWLKETKTSEYEL